MESFNYTNKLLRLCTCGRILGIIDARGAPGGQSHGICLECYRAYLQGKLMKEVRP